MFIEAGSVPVGTVVSADVCIIGAGAAGITLARELARSSHRVLLLESGPLGFDEAANDLNAGTSIGRPYMDLASSRQRFFGGTTNHWGGWCLPQDRIDFERGWPIPRTELDPFYRRAQDVLQLGPYDYRPASWGIRPRDVPKPFAGPHFVTKMLQNSPPTRFNETYGPELRRSSRISVYLNATVVQITTDDSDSLVDHLLVATPSGTRFTARAGAYVLACGGVENARLLLLSGQPGAGGLGNTDGQVGRGFMVHLQCPGGTIAVADPQTDFDFYTNVTSNGREYAPYRHRFVSFVGLSEATMQAQGLPNVRLMWDFDYAPGMRTITALRSAASWNGSGHRLADVAAVMSDLGGAGMFTLRRLFSYWALPVQALHLGLTLEPTRNPDSRIRLGSSLDALGQRRVEVDWRVSPVDLLHARTVMRLLAAEIGATGFGRLFSPFELGDPQAWPQAMFGDHHHMGTTRMSQDTADGVVDPDCRMHGVQNLYVAGSSVFPRAGVANPTLTITALAIRLAAHLRSKLG